MSMRRFRTHLVVCLLTAGALASCFSAPRNGEYRIRVRSDPPGAVATLGEQSITTPGTLILRGTEPVTIRFAKPGCAPGAVTLRRETTSGPRRTQGDGGGSWPEPLPEPAGGAPGQTGRRESGTERSRATFGLLAHLFNRRSYEHWPSQVGVRLDCAAPRAASHRASP